MIVSKDFDKIPKWDDSATELDNIAYQLYINDALNADIHIHPQALIIFLENKQYNSIKYYDIARIILRKQKIEKIKNGYKET